MLKTTSPELVSFYLSARESIRASAFGAELEWQSTRLPVNTTERDFLCETAWVILCSGFKERTVRHIFDYISLSFCDWESAGTIVRHERLCRTAALQAFSNTQKIDAILGSARLVNSLGFKTILERVLKNPISELQMFPFIGPVTSYHLAKNLGFDVVKPDRHLVRLAERFGFDNPSQMCCFLSHASGDSLNVIDLTLWRFLAEKLPLHQA